MKIECILKRAGGTKVLLGGTRYHFAPDLDDRHVAQVEDVDHAKILLAVPEGYRSLDPLPVQRVSMEDAMAVLREQFPHADFSSLMTKPAPAPADAPQAPEPDDEPISDDDEDTGLSDLSDADLRVEFEKLLGRKPHANMLRENMEAQVLSALGDSK